MRSILLCTWGRSQAALLIGGSFRRSSGIPTLSFSISQWCGDSSHVWSTEGGYGLKKNPDNSCRTHAPTPQEAHLPLRTKCQLPEHLSSVFLTGAGGPTAFLEVFDFPSIRWIKTWGLIAFCGYRLTKLAETITAGFVTGSFWSFPFGFN